MNTIRWKDIPGHSGYEVSDDGRIRSRWGKGALRPDNPPRELRAFLSGKPSIKYPSVNLRGKRIQIHRTMAIAFFGEPTENQECRHLNGNRCDNRLANLKWGTRVEQSEDKRSHGTDNGGVRNGRAKLTRVIVTDARIDFERGVTIAELARDHGVTHHTMNSAVRGLSWK